MKPIGPLMIEHRLISRMIKVLKMELSKIRSNKEVDPVFIDIVVDFIRFYADKTHHGKEEDILFRELKKKDLSKIHEKTMNDLIKEHIFARKTTGNLVEAKEKYIKGDTEKLKEIIEMIETLVEFYPNHIETEDKHFFIPVIDYFTEEEQNQMLEEGRIFDRKMIHRKYEHIVSEYEDMLDITSKRESTNWIDRI
ncbi:MAG: cation-binding protein [Candidatus Lokiarchaeota archaeon]|nr:cation-binding protein [Candidatus Lokiarchaeota archaeon]